MPKSYFPIHKWLTLSIFICGFSISSKAQNSTVYGITQGSTFSHIDIITGEVTLKDNLNIDAQIGTSTYDPETRNYFIAGYKDTTCYLVTVNAPAGKKLTEQVIPGNSEWHGFEFDIVTKKIYGTRMNLDNYDFYFATIDPVNQKYSEVAMGKNSASQAGSAIDYKNGYYFFGSSAGGFKLNTIDIKTGAKLYSVNINLPTGSYHYDTSAQKLYGIYTSVPRVVMSTLDYKNGNHTYDSVPYLREVSIINSWYTYDGVNGNYIIPAQTNNINTLHLVNAKSPKVIHSVETSSHFTELEYGATLPNNLMQVSGEVKSSEGKVLENATIYAATKDAAGNITLSDSTQTNTTGDFTLTTSQQDFYIYIRPDKQLFPDEAPTWYPGVVQSAAAEIYKPEKGINFINITSKNISALSVKNTVRNKQANLFPNPAQNSLNINSAGEINKLEITDALGRIVLKCNTISSSNLSIALPETMKKGIYYVKLYYKDGVTSISFIKLPE